MDKISDKAKQDASNFQESSFNMIEEAEKGNEGKIYTRSVYRRTPPNNTLHPNHSESDQ